ncbi:MAG: methyltransferase domain-containing protein [Candidatus Nanopelagicales bacterium]
MPPTANHHVTRPAGVTAADEWTNYLAQYHEAHPGITEEVLSGSRHPTFGDPYRWLRDAAPYRPARVLDIACGSAPMQPLFADSEYLGIDLSHAELSVARARGRGPVLTADALALPVESGSLDIVVCSMAIMLLRPIDAAIAEIARVLRPGGTFAAIRPVSTPLLPRDLRTVAPLLLALRHTPELPQHFTGRGLGQVITRAGLSIISTQGARFAHPLATPADARLAVEALYLPHVPDTRRDVAAAHLARRAGPGREVPVSLHRVVAVRAGAI